MNVEVLSRIQFGLTSGFHFIFPPLNIGLGLCMVIIEAISLTTKAPIYQKMAKYWTRVFALIFSLGVATGLVQLFGFGTNWASYSRYVGDVFGSALGADGIFAFFLESGFLAILLFGWDRVSPKLHFFSTLMVALGAHFSALWILAANSWMQTPIGHKVVGTGENARAVVTNFWEMAFNLSTIDRIAHTVVACWITGAFLVVSISAYYLLKKQHLEFARSSMRIGLIVAGVAIILQLITGDMSAKGVAKNQPIKLAAFEGVFNTTDKPTPLYAFGYVDTETETVTGLAIPAGLSFLVHGNFTTPVSGLDKVPEGWSAKDRPNVAVVFQTYHLMIGMWALMFVSLLVATFLWKRNTLETSKWTLRILILSVVFPQIANLAGWMSAEMGRQPWIVYGLLRTSQGLSKNIVASQVLGSLIMFIIIYTTLFVMFLYLLHSKIKEGPEALTTAETARNYFDEKKRKHRKSNTQK